MLVSLIKAVVLTVTLIVLAIRTIRFCGSVVQGLYAIMHVIFAYNLHVFVLHYSAYHCDC